MGKEHMKKRKEISNKKAAKPIQKLGERRWWASKTLDKVTSVNENSKN